MCRLDQRLRDLAVDAWHADVEARPQEEGAVGIVQIDLGIDLRIGWELDLSLGRGELDRTDEAGRPCGAEEILGGRVRLRQLDIEKAVAAARGAVTAGRDVRVLPVRGVFRSWPSQSPFRLNRIQSNRMRCEINQRPTHVKPFRFNRMRFI